MVHNPEKKNTGKTYPPADLPLAENENSLEKKNIEEEREVEAKETSLEKLIKNEEITKEMSEFMHTSKESSLEIKSTTDNIKDMLKLFLPVISALLLIILLLVFLVYRINKGILKNLEFLRQEDAGQRSGIITDKGNGSIEVAIFDPESNDKKKLRFKLDNFSEFSEVNLNFCYVWKEHKKEMSRIMPNRPWYPTFLLYILQWTSMSPYLYPPFPCDRQQISDRGLIFEDKIGFGEIKKNDYVIVRSKRKGNDLHIVKVWKIRPTFLMPLLTDKQ